MTPDRIERATVIHARADRVWQALTTAEALGTWFGDAGAEIDLRPGGVFRLHWAEHGVAHGRVERVEPTTGFAFRWNVAPGDDSEPTERNSTLVEFTLEERDGATTVSVVESGFSTILDSDDARARHREGNIEGWEKKLGELAAHAERATV